MDTTNRLSGPDFLDAVADQEAANGNDINAATFRERALQWKRDRILLQRLEDSNQATVAQLKHIAQCATGAITPTDTRKAPEHA